MTEEIKLTGATAIIDDGSKEIVITGKDAGDLGAPWFAELVAEIFLTPRANYKMVRR